MADANENAPTDTTSLKRAHRSSLRRAARPPFEDVDTNVTGDVPERRRLSKRVSFSDTNQIKVFEREQSGELGHSTENASASAVSGCCALPVTIIDDGVAKKEEVDELLQFQCGSVHEQSFYQGEEGESDDCSPLKKISPLDDPLSCHLFRQVGAPPGDAISSTRPNRTIFAHETMDLTAAAMSVCDGAASPAPSSFCPNRTTLAHETMNLTAAAIPACGNVSVAHSPSCAHSNRTTLAHENMDLTAAAISVRDDTVSAEPTGTRFFHNLPMEITTAAFPPQPGLALPCGSEIKSYGHSAMNVTCMTSEVGVKESPCSGDSPAGEGATVTARELRNESSSPFEAEPACEPLKNILQMVSLKDSSRQFWWDDEPRGGKTCLEGEASSALAPGVEASRPVLFGVDRIGADATNRELASSTVMPLDGMEMTCANPGEVTGTLQYQMSMTCANMTGSASNLLLDTTCPSAGPVELLNIGSPSPTPMSETSQHSGHVAVCTTSQLAVDSVDVSTGMEENAACSLIEDPRFLRTDTLAVYNTAVGHASDAGWTDKMQIEATVTRVHHSFTVSSSEPVPVVTPPMNDASLGEGPRDVPLVSETNCPSFLEGTPKRKHANAAHAVEAFARSGTPAKYTPSRRGNSAGKQAGTPLPGVVVLSSKESIALQLLVSPANKSVTRLRTPNRLSSIALSQSSKCHSASLKKSLSAVHKMFNDVLDSTGHVPPGLDVSALLGTSVHSVSSLTLLDDVFSPTRPTAQARSGLHCSAVGALEHLTEASQQEKGASSLRVAEEGHQVAKTVPYLDKMGAEGGAEDQGRVAALPVKECEDTKKSTSGVVGSHLQAAAKNLSIAEDKALPAKGALVTNTSSVVTDKMQDGTLAGPSASCHNSASSELQRKSATFVVNAGHGRSSATFIVDARVRPSATFTTSSPASGVACNYNSSSSADAAVKEPLLAASAPKHALASSCSKQRGDELNSESDHGSDTHSTVTPRSRKRLQFADVVEEPATEHSGCHSINQSGQGMSTLASVVPGTTGPRRLLDHDGSSGSQQPVGNRSNAADEEMVMDVAEPTFVSSSDEKSAQESLPASQKDGRDSTNLAGVSLPAEQRQVPSAGPPENKLFNESTEALPGTSPISASTFYSASSARKKSKPSPPLLPLRSSGKAASASTSRSAKGIRKRHLQATPTTADKRRKASKEARGSHRKPKRDTSKKVSAPPKSTPKSPRQAAKSVPAPPGEISDDDDSFSYGVRLPSLPTTPVEKEAGLEEATQDQELQSDPRRHAGVELPAPVEFEEADPCKELFDNIDPELNLTAGIDIEGILDRLDDANVQESLYWSVCQLPKSLQEAWQLRICEALPHKGIFTFAGNILELTVSLGDFELPGTCTEQALEDASSGKVRRRTKRITALRLRICRNAKCGPFSKFMCRRLMENCKTDELLQRYPATDSLGQMLGEVGEYFVRHRPLSWDIGRATRSRSRSYGYTFTDDSVLSIEVTHPARCVWFYMDLPINVDTYPHAEILPSSRPYSGPLEQPGDEYVVIRTEKLRRITARVAPGPHYLTRIVDEVEAFMNKR